MILMLVHVFSFLLYFVVEKMQPLYIGNCSPKEPPGPTAIFQRTFRNHPEAPKELQGAPKSSQGAPRESPGGPKSPSFCPASSLRDHRGPPKHRSRAPKELPGTPKQHPRVVPSAHRPPMAVHKATPNHPKSSQDAPKLLANGPKSFQDRPKISKTAPSLPGLCPKSAPKIRRHPKLRNL